MGGRTRQVDPSCFMERMPRKALSSDRGNGHGTTPGKKRGDFWLEDPEDRILAQFGG